MPGIKIPAASHPDALAVGRPGDHTEAGNLGQIGHGRYDAVWKNGAIGEHPALGVVLQPVKPHMIDDQQVARIFDSQLPLTKNMDRISSGGEKSLAVPSIQIFFGGHPDGAVWIRQ